MSATGLKGLMKLDGSLLETFVMFSAEIMGTAILVFIGCIGCVGGLSTAPTQMQIGLTFGFAATISVTIFGHISGAHINPSVTIAAVILGKTTIPNAGIYILGQCVGGTIGYGLLMLLTPYSHRHGGDLASSNELCVTMVNGGISTLQGLMVEIIATWILILVCGGIWDPRNENQLGSIPIKIGITISALIMAVGPYSGCSINSARSLGPAVWNNNYKDHWVYWVGPNVGAIFGSLNYLMYTKLMPKKDGDGGGTTN